MTNSYYKLAIYHLHFLIEPEITKATSMAILQKLAIIFLLFMSISSYANNNLTSPELQYILQYNNPILHISLNFDGCNKEQIVLQLSSSFTGATNNITHLKISGAQIKKITPHIILLHKITQQKINLTYDVTQTWIGPLNNFSHFLLPILQNNYFQFIGSTVLIYPQLDKNSAKLRVNLLWQTPQQWKLANSYGISLTRQKITTSINDLLSSLFIGGDFNLYQISTPSGIIWTAIRGNWPFSATQFNQKVARVMAHERKFWHAAPNPYFLISLIPVYTQQPGMTGTGLTHAFALALTAHSPLNNLTDYVIAHEAFHAWNKPEIFNITAEKQAYYYWFTEGFTDYYANLLNLRMGLLTLPAYIKQYNKILVDYYSSPVNSATIAQVKKNFWQNFFIEKLPYQQGMILATNWNTQIKQATNNTLSLDNLLRAFVFSVQHENTKLTLKKMDRLATRYKKIGLLRDIQSIYAGNLIIPDKYSLGPCVQQKNKMLAPYALGFDLAASQAKKIITRVQPNSKAFRAGLRNGQQFVAIQGKAEDITRMLTVTVKEKGQIKIIKFYPYQGVLKSIPQFILEQKRWLAYPQECLAWFNG